MCPRTLNPPGFDVILLLFARRLTKVEVDDMNNQVCPTERNITLLPLHQETFRRIKHVEC